MIWPRDLGNLLGSRKLLDIDKRSLLPHREPISSQPGGLAPTGLLFHLVVQELSQFHFPERAHIMRKEAPLE